MLRSAEISLEIFDAQNERNRLQKIVNTINNESIETTQSVIDNELSVFAINLTEVFAEDGYGYIENVKTKRTQLYNAFLKVSDDLRVRTQAIIKAKNQIVERIRQLNNQITTLQAEKTAALAREKAAREAKKKAEEEKRKKAERERALRE